jgi:hypothetical protein
MYIPEFWLGIASAIGGELALLIIALIISYIKDHKKR